MKSHRSLAVSLGVFALSIAPSLTAQCATQWVPGGGYNGVYGRVHAVASWDPDGSGPLPARLVSGGDFSFAGTVPANRIVALDPASGSWSEFGSGMNIRVRALLPLPNGDLVAGGDFTTAGGVACNSVARWDGTTWSPLGSGITVGGFNNPSVRSLAVLPNGDIVVGGAEFTAVSSGCHGIARWDGTTWSPLGSGMNGTVMALAVLPSGDLVAGGDFTTAGGVACSRLALWNGTAWSPFGGGVGNFGSLHVDSLKVMSNGDLLAGGNFSSAGGVACNRIARWNGTVWSPLGTGTNDAVHSLAVLPNGDIVAGGDMTVAGGVACSKIARWNGAVWSPLGTGTDNAVNCLTVLPNGDLVAGGLLASAGGLPCNGVARWTGLSWLPVASGVSDRATGPNDYPVSVAALPDGDVVAGLTHVTVDGVVSRYVARGDGTTWSPLGSGVNSNVTSLAVLRNGDVVAGGQFTLAGGVACNRIARWDGTTWWPLGSGMGQHFVYALTELPNGDLVAGGVFSTAGGEACNNIARWDGTAWSPLGAGTDMTVRALAVLPNGDLVAGGFFATAGGVACNRIARWDGTAWSPLGSGTNGTVLALTVLPNGDLVAGGTFSTAGSVATNGIARWDGTSWWPLGSGMASDASWPAIVNALSVLPNGDLVAGGQFTAAGGVSCNHIARWDGASWAELGAGLMGYPQAGSQNPPRVNALAVLPSGDLVAAGLFTHAGEDTSVYVARWATTCPANVTTLPTQCVGPAGPLTLTADVAPFVGTLYRSTTTGFDDNALAANLLGWHAPGVWLPFLSHFHCRLLAGPALVDFMWPTGGVAEWQLQLPASSTLAGMVLYQQSVQITLLPWQPPLSTSNALKLTIGSY